MSTDTHPPSRQWEGTRNEASAGDEGGRASMYMRQLMACLEIGKALTSTFDMEEILQTTLSRLSDLVPATNWSVLLLDPSGRELYFEVAVGLAPELTSVTRIPVGEGIAGTVAATGEPIVVRDVTADPRFSSRIDQLSGFKTKSIICLPLKIRGEVIGVVEVVNPQETCLFRKDALTVLSVLADYIAIAIGNARNYKTIASLALTDTVTGYYNTRFLHRYLEELLESQGSREVSLVFVDMDDFKKVVDTHGHLLGSKVLKEVADAMAARLTPEDRLVRYGGDEFVILMENCHKRLAVERSEELRKAIARTRFLESEGLFVNVTASFGLATYPQDASTREELMRLADHSMFASKERGKNRVTVYGIPF